jgi:hypothetical protein
MVLPGSFGKEKGGGRRGVQELQEFRSCRILKVYRLPGAVLGA